MKRIITILLFGAMNLAIAAPAVSSETADDTAAPELVRKISGAAAGAVAKANTFLSDRSRFPTVYAPPAAGDIDYRIITLAPRDNLRYAMKIIGMDKTAQPHTENTQEQSLPEFPYSMSP